MNRRRLILLLVLTASVGAACAPVKGGPPSGVVLWGDSFAEQAAPHLPYEARVYGGTAPCDWLPQMRERAASHPPAVAVLLFAGSTFTPCTGGTIDGYPRDTHEAIRVLSTAGTRVVVIAAPCLKSGANPVNTVYTDGGVPLAWGPHNSVCPGGVYDEAYRQSDQHLNPNGAARFAHEIRVVAG
jgi:hypothetical protein